MTDLIPPPARSVCLTDRQPKIRMAGALRSSLSGGQAARSQAAPRMRRGPGLQPHPCRKMWPEVRPGPCGALTQMAAAAAHPAKTTAPRPDRPGAVGFRPRTRSIAPSPPTARCLEISRTAAVPTVLPTWYTRTDPDLYACTTMGVAGGNAPPQAGQTARPPSSQPGAQSESEAPCAGQAARVLHAAVSATV